MVETYTIENILDHPNVTEILPDNTAIAFHWVASEYGISIGKKNIERVKNFSQSEPQRTFYVVVHGLYNKQIDELNKSFSDYPNIKVLNFKSLKLDDQYDLHTLDYTENGKSKRMRLSQYWNDMYSEKVTRRMHLSNEIDSMKYHLVASFDQIVGPGKPLAVFDFDTLPAEGKKIGEVKIIKGGVLLARLPKEVSTLKQETLDLPILAISKEENEILKSVRKKIKDDSTDDAFFKANYVANMILGAIKTQNTFKILELLALNESSSSYDEMYDEIYDKRNHLFAFNRAENVMIISDGSWHDKNYISGTEEEKVNTGATSQLVTPTSPQQTQLLNGAPQTRTSNGANNNLPPKVPSSQPPITTHNSKQEHFLGISPRGWIMIAAAAIIGALALYFLAPLILSATVGLGSKLGLGAAGAALGGGIGYLTDVAINKCCSKEAGVQPA
jgi:hypothetical protein